MTDRRRLWQVTVAGVLLLIGLWVAFHLARFSLPPDSSSLLRAIASEDVEAAKRLLAEGASARGGSIPLLRRLVEVQHREAEAPLHLAIRKGNAQIVELLLSAGADPNAAGANGYRPLHIAVGRGHKRIAELLISQGARVNLLAEAPQRDSLMEGRHSRVAQRGQSVLSAAVLAGNCALAGYLLEKGAHLANEPKLAGAALRGHAEEVRRLLNEGRRPVFRAEAGLTALHCGAVAGHASIVRHLLAHGAALDAKTDNGRAPFHLAVCAGHRPIIQLLLEEGAEVNVPDATGKTGLHCAAEHGHPGVTELLLRNGADAHQVDLHGWTPLHWAARNGHVASARALIRQGAAVDLADKYGFTPLHCAVAQQQDRMVELLLARGASADATTDSAMLPAHEADKWGHYTSFADQYTPVAQARIFGEAPLHLAARNGAARIVTMLVEAGAAVNVTEKGHSRTPLHLAAETGHTDVVRRLLAAGADAKAMSSLLGTPLHSAVAFGRTAVAQLLLGAGGRPDVPNSLGQTPMEMARQMGDDHMVAVLRKHSTMQ